MIAPKPIRILLIDDHAIVRTGLRLLIDSQPGMVVVGEAANRAEALELADRLQPDIILLDLMLGEESGLDLLPELRSLAQRSRVLLLTGVHDTEEHLRAVRLGATGLVLKSQASEMLIKAIEKIHAGEVWLDAAIVASVVAEVSGRPADRMIDPEAAKLATLTQREREVIALICEGLSNKSIGERLHISETTVRHHLTSIFDKLGVTNRLELVIYAYRHGLARLAG
jgi:DNA-binding NarL/FixJ family response regulator